MNNLIISADTYFKDRLQELNNKQLQPICPIITDYLAIVISKNIFSENFFVDKDGKKEQPVLAFLLKEALESESHLKISKYQKLAETSLVVAGCFPNFFKNKLINIQYYVDMSSQSYLELHNYTNNNLYLGVSEQMVKIIYLLNELVHNIDSENDPVKLTELWILTKNPKIARKLQSLGIKI